jgi:hypothetical protein
MAEKCSCSLTELQVGRKREEQQERRRGRKEKANEHGRRTAFVENTGPREG